MSRHHHSRYQVLIRWGDFHLNITSRRTILWWIAFMCAIVGLKTFGSAGARQRPDLMRTKLRSQPRSAESGVVTRATVTAAERLGLKNNALAKILGLSESTISRMRRGGYFLQPGGKDFELGVLFVRFYRSLDAIVGGSDAVSADWIRNKNTALGATPLELIQSVAGLANVLEYLDARRAAI